MPPPDAHDLDYERVDDVDNVPFLVATMEATSRWDSIRELRAWERARLALRSGERLLDVGCGLGDAAMALAADLGADGEVVGVDASAAMLAVARERASAPCAVRFVVGDVMALDEADASFDAARCERTLQWITDPAAAVAELARVLRPGGRLALIDTDWSTLVLDVGDDDMTAAVHDVMATEGDRAWHVGARLGRLVSDAGFVGAAETSVRHRWTQWDPDEAPAPDGCFSMRSLADEIVEAGRLDRAEADRFVETVHDAARHGRFTMALTIHAVVARLPDR